MTATPRSAAKSGVLALDSLPTLPVVALRIGELVHARTTSVAQLAEVLGSDPSLSAKLLRLVNSSYFAIPGGVSDVARAIPFVGFNTLYQLVLSISVLDALTPNAQSGLDPRVFWLHSLSVGTAARVIAEDLRGAEPDTCFTAGLLHDIGTIALAKLDPVRLAGTLAEVARTGISVAQAEALHGLPAHDEIGGRLARQWRFPSTLAAPIEHHHAIHLAAVRDRIPSGPRAVAEIVAGADHLAQRCAASSGLPTGGEDCDDSVAATMFDRLGLSAPRLDALYSKTMVRLEASKVFLTLIGS